MRLSSPSSRCRPGWFTRWVSSGISGRARIDSPLPAWTVMALSSSWRSTVAVLSITSAIVYRGRMSK